MKYKNLLELIKRAILFKRSKKNKLKENIMHEAKEIQKKRTDLSEPEKRTMLKKIYKRVLTGTPYAENIDIFMKLINEVPESYLGYELSMNLDKAMVMVDELIRGTGDFTENEMQNIANIVAGVGIPAIEKHATKAEKLSKRTGEFGSKAMDKNIGELLKSMRQRKETPAIPARTLGKEPVVVSKALTREDRLALQEKIKNRLGMVFRSKLAGETEFAKLASQLKAPKAGMVDRLASSLTGIVANAKSYVEAKKKAEALGIEFKKGDDFFRSFFNAAQRQKQREKVKVKVKAKTKK